MTETLEPIAPGLWAENGEPRLVGGRLPGGAIVFPIPEGDAADGVEPVALSRSGTLWSWTSQDFRPKSPPFEGPEQFEPFLLGYVELPGQVIVETRIVEAALDDLSLGMKMELVIIPFDDHRTTFAFRPTDTSWEKAS
jgi:uncharacterized OB-fold protein